ncbi:unnamed protein product [Peronospora farinosa]|uniref:Uncharacterized protein n=1 Tax=Peronospora farinosa TaxID=134698 RepID=A0AAV0SN94_9STRA|nr:unnamed protein product [Peronospora farinosa]CAI5704224.1 unnamed protein product [Peronospora farinosa]
MTLSSVHTSGLPSILKYTNITLNSTFTATPMMPSLSPNLLQRDVFDYDFNRERIFLEIDDELARQSTKLSLSSSLSSTGHQDGTTFKPRSTSEEDVAAAISASLRDY